jgi:hypothetical protein
MAFYTPGQNWSQASHALASVAQLHAQMAVGVWKLKCIEKPDGENAKRAESMVDEWSKRYVDIQTVAAAVGATPTPGTSPSGGPVPEKVHKTASWAFAGYATEPSREYHAAVALTIR